MKKQNFLSKFGTGVKVCAALWMAVLGILLTMVAVRVVLVNYYRNQALEIQAERNADEEYNYNQDLWEYSNDCYLALSGSGSKDYYSSLKKLDTLIQTHSYDTPLPDVLYDDDVFMPYLKSSAEDYFLSLIKLAMERLQPLLEKYMDYNKYNAQRMKVESITFGGLIASGSVLGILTIILVILLIRSKKKQVTPPLQQPAILPSPDNGNNQNYQND